jgi:hypothetical protein
VLVHFRMDYFKSLLEGCTISEAQSSLLLPEQKSEGDEKGGSEQEEGAKVGGELHGKQEAAMGKEETTCHLHLQP